MTSRQIPLNPGDLTLDDVGQGRPVLLLHGAAGPAGMTPLVDHFAAGCRVLTPTHPGWDDTPRPDWCCGVDDLALTYLDVLEDDDLRDVLVIGTSFGGWIASEMAVRDRAHRIGRLVLLDAIGPEIPGRLVQMRQGGGTQGPGGLAHSAIETVQAYAGPSMSDAKLLRRLARVAAPALVLWGERDTLVTPDFGRAYAAAFADARFALIPDAGHMPVREAPAAVFAAIDGFLEES